MHGRANNFQTFFTEKSNPLPVVITLNALMTYSCNAEAKNSKDRNIAYFLLLFWFLLLSCFNLIDSS